MRVLVIGGSGHIGSRVCATLQQRDARVAYTWRTEPRVELDGVLPLRLDLTAPVAALEEVVRVAHAELGGLDALVHCAGVSVQMECDDPVSGHLMPSVDESAWEQVMAVNLKSVFFACRAVAPYLAERGGNIVLTGSADAVKPAPSPVHYAASKGGVVAMVRAMAKEVGVHDIRVNGVAPGILDGGISRGIPEAVLTEYRKHSASGRVGDAGEVARLISWLALHNTYVSGQTIVLDGGL